MNNVGCDYFSHFLLAFSYTHQNSSYMMLIYPSSPITILVTLASRHEKMGTNSCDDSQRMVSEYERELNRYTV